VVVEGMGELKGSTSDESESSNAVGEELNPGLVAGEESEERALPGVSELDGVRPACGRRTGVKGGLMPR